MKLPAHLSLLVVLLLLVPASARAAEGLVTLEEVQGCIKANIPATTSVQTVEFVARDKVGFEKTTRAKIYAKQGDDKLRRVLTLFTKPVDLRGAQYLMVEQASGPNDMWLYTPELRKAKRVSGRAASGSLFGTDFSFEDFERLHNLNRPGDSALKEHAVVMDRPVYVIETMPAQNEGSAYELVATFVDQKTCVALKTESYERGRRLRKVLTADPDQILQVEKVWVAHELLMTDARDDTWTRLVVESVEVGVPIKDRTFLQSQLGKNLR